MSIDDSSTERQGGKGRRTGIAAAVAALAALAIGIAVLMVSLPPEQKVSAGQAEPALASAAVAQAPAVGAEVAASAAAVSPSAVADVVAEATPEATAPTPPDDSESHATLTDRSGERTAVEPLDALEVVTVAEKQDNAVAALTAARAVQASDSLTVDTGFEKAPPTATPKATSTPKPTPKPAPPAPAPRPLTNPSGGWIELPNVRPIPSTYYNAVHQWDPIVNHFAGVYRIDPDLIRRIIYVESKGYQYAYVGSTGVKGLMQIAPIWFKAGENPYDPYTNIGKGAYILRRGYDAYHTWFLAVTYYCYGPLGRYGSNVPTMYAGLIYSPIIRSL